MRSAVPSIVPNSADSFSTLVARSYAQVATLGGLHPRASQVALSELIASTLTSATPLIAEAPTGTGKTLAYLIGALAATERKRLPVVVATATKALQQQLMAQDLPRLYAAGLLKPENVALAKGKSNYLCVRGALAVQSNTVRAARDHERFLDERAFTADLSEVTEALEAYREGSWNGDFDAYPKNLSEGTRRATAVSSETCYRKTCEHASDCAYYKAKARVAGCQIIVANHDLLLQDLRLGREGFEPVLELSEYHLVVDEAHHLPQKAIQVGARTAPLSQLFQALPALTGAQKLLETSVELSALLATQGIVAKGLDRADSTRAVRTLILHLSTRPVSEDSGTSRFKGGLDAETTQLVCALLVPITALVGELQKAGQALRELTGLASAPLEVARELQLRILDVYRPALAVQECAKALIAEEDYAKWLFIKGASLSLHCAPLEGAPVLKALLWPNPRVRGIVMVSATLQDTAGFNRFRMKSGAPASAVYSVLPHTFAYTESTLTVWPMRFSPKFAERAQFLAELHAELPKALDPGEGTLILFPSWAMLRELTPTLKAQFGAERVKVQGELPVRALVQAHREDVDRGAGSVLVGVATLSEGLDLPGAYCTHVCIVALPFSVPSDPVEEEVAERLGSRYFSERSMPDALQRLTQMVGRLLRRETDRGRVTVFDRRLRSTAYGQKMLKALPPFKLLS